jgi:hypothetical protein
MPKVKIRFIPTILVVAVVTALLYGLGPLGPGTGTSHQGKVVRAEVTLDHGSFAVQLTTQSNFTGLRDWVPDDRTYTGSYSQDVLVAPNERVVFYLTAATDIDRSEVAKRTLRCQLYEDGKALPGDAKHSLPIRRGEAGEPVACAATVSG